MNFVKWFTAVFTGCLIVFHAYLLNAGAKRPAEGPLITVRAPQPQQFEIALDEIELDWSVDPGAKVRQPAQAPALIPGTAILESQATRALVSVPGVTDPKDLLPTAVALKAANPGSDVHLALYEPGLPKSRATRRLLTREVGLLMERGEAPTQVLGGLSAASVRPVPGVADGYVVEAADPLAALDLAEALRQRPGVRSAYPLLKRHYFPR